MKYLITGGAGYIGSNTVCRILEEKEHEVVIVDNFSTGFQENINPKAKLYNADLKDLKALRKIFEIEKNIDVILDFAAFISVPESVSKPIIYFENNLESLKNILVLMKEFQIRNIIFSSTAAVYGEAKIFPVVEDVPVEPINPYGASKLAAELLLKSFAIKNNISFIIFRYFNVAGTHKSLEVGIRNKKVSHLIPSINKVFLGHSKEFMVYGTDYPTTKDGSCLRDYIHVIDLADAHILGANFLFSNEIKREVINLGSGNGFTVLEICKKAQKIHNRKIKIVYKKRREGDPEKLLANTKKAKNILNWEPKLSLKDMITSDYEFQRKIDKK